MTVIIVARDLIIATRIADAAVTAGHAALRVDGPDALPAAESVSIAFVDWGARESDWGVSLTRWCAGAPESHRPRLVIFGPHSDLAAHAEARAAGLGPMLARSKLVASLRELLAAAREDNE